MLARPGMSKLLVCALAVAGLIGCAHQSSWKAHDSQGWPLQTWQTQPRQIAPSVAQQCRRAPDSGSRSERICCDQPVPNTSWGRHAVACEGRGKRETEAQPSAGKVIVETYRRTMTPEPPVPTTPPASVEPSPIAPPGDRAINVVRPRATLIGYTRP